MKKRQIRMIIAILLTAVLLTACAKNPPTNVTVPTSFAASEQIPELTLPFDQWDSDYSGDPITLRMLSISANSRITQAIADFNRQSHKYHIELESLFPWDHLITAAELNNAILKLNSQFISGDIPDLIDLYELPAEVYYTKGIIENLKPYMEIDPEIKAEDYFGNVLDAMMVNGGLPYITNGVGFRTMIGPKELAGAEPGWTLNEMNTMLDEKGLSALGNLNGKLFINLMLYTHEYFVDWQTGDCHFSSDEFIGMLELAKRIQSAQVGDIVIGEYVPHYVSFEGISNFYVMAQLRSSYKGDLEFLGFPTDQGEYHAVFPESRVAMSSSCQDKEGAWKFLRTLLTEQQEYCLLFPIQRTAFDAVAAATISGESDWKSAYPDVVVNETDIAYVKALMERTKYPYSTNGTIQEIVQDELADFFSGKENARGTAKRIEKRVKIYLGEQM